MVGLTLLLSDCETGNAAHHHTRYERHRQPLPAPARHPLDSNVVSSIEADQTRIDSKHAGDLRTGLGNDGFILMPDVAQQYVSWSAYDGFL
jgi:hypothetical protein